MNRWEAPLKYYSGRCKRVRYVKSKNDDRCLLDCHHMLIDDHGRYFCRIGMMEVLP